MGSDRNDGPSSADAMAHVAMSTEQLADQERQAADRADADRATQKDRVDEGRLHGRSAGDRGTTGGA